MKKHAKTLTSFIIFILLFSGLSEYIYANELDPEKAIVVSESNELIPILKEASENSEVFKSIPNQSEITILNEESIYTYISYIDSITDEEITGYIKTTFINAQERLEEDPVQSGEENKDVADEETAVTPIETEESLEPEEPVETEIPIENPNIPETSNKPNTSKETDLPNEEKTDTELVKPIKMFSAKEVTTVIGIALKNPTNIYSETNEDAAVLKSYPQGTFLKYESSDTNWHQCTVYINGKATTGFIKKSDVEIPISPQTSLKGIVKNSRLNVYSKASVSADVLKSYTEGSLVKFKTFTTDWYKATVYLKGKATTGYIHKSDVIIPDAQQTNLKGIVKNKRLNVYSKVTDSSNVLKSYREGTVVKYKTFTENWYEATVYIKGKATTGYIQNSDVISLDTPQTNLKGIAKNSRLNVYSKVSKSSSVLKSYAEGTVVRYKSFTANWYEATVYIKGKATTGYIHKNDVISPDDSQTDVRGIAKNGSLSVYSKASTSSGVLKQYAQGSVLKYRTFTSNWYEATVYVNGKAKTGYIHKSDVENIVSSQKTLRGVAQERSGVKVFTKASTDSSILKSYPKGKTLKYRTFTSEWYEATVFIKGKATKGYIKKSSMKKGLKGKTIVIDAGHGDFDHGAKGVEKTLNIQTAKQLQSILKSAGVDVIMTRSSDIFLSLSERVDISHRFNADAFISIHYNSNPSSSPHGIETYYWTTNADERELAQYIQEEVIKQTGLYNRGVKTGNFHVIRENNNPSILVELGFLSNPTELKIVSTKAYQRRAAKGIYKGIEKYFNH